MNRYTRLDDEVELSNERYLDDVQSKQQVQTQTWFLTDFSVLYLKVKVNVDLYSARLVVNTLLRRSGMARFLRGSHR